METLISAIPGVLAFATMVLAAVGAIKSTLQHDPLDAIRWAVVLQVAGVGLIVALLAHV